MAEVKYALRLSNDDEAELRKVVNSPTAAQRSVLRAKIVLESASGRSISETASALGTSRQTVCLWRRRFHQAGLPGIEDEHRSGRPPTIAQEVAAKIIDRAVHGEGAVSSRKVARETGVSKDTVQRIWRQNDLKPHLLRTFKLSNDPQFESKFWDIIGLYHNPPEKAVVLCCDEKSQIQALERTQPGLPLGVGHIRTQTHDYYRHGTITLFAALDYLTGKTIFRTESRHRHTEWLRFLKQIDADTPEDVDIHIILDNYGTHKHKKVKAWLAKHPRLHMHFTPTSASWMNLVERFFRDISEEAIRIGSFTHVKQLTECIFKYLADHNAHPKRYVWHADGKEILEKIMRARKRIADRYASQAN
ncbi:MAG TPA: IS630 family transposase [Phycisphaerales bacterium]|nr:IS630 family transposase [Phycisphaerales bacterium]